MATDAQGRQLSDDGYYYWDGANWQPVTESGAGRQLSEDGNYYWDGANWQLVDASAGNGGGAGTGQTITADDIITWAHALTTAAEVAEIFGHIPETLGVWVEPIDGVILVIDMVFNTGPVEPEGLRRRRQRGPRKDERHGIQEPRPGPHRPRWRSGNDRDQYLSASLF
jgi:hypothetical protein